MNESGSTSEANPEAEELRERLDAVTKIGIALSAEHDLRSLLRTILLAAGVASLIKFAQLFVFSRFLDTTDIFTSTAGAWIGAWLASVFRLG